MGFKNEFASYEPLRRILDSTKVQTLQDRLRVRKKDEQLNGQEEFESMEVDPEKFWGSRAPDSDGAPRYDDFTTGTDADHAVIFTIAPPMIPSIEAKIAIIAKPKTSVASDNPKIPPRTARAPAPNPAKMPNNPPKMPKTISAVLLTIIYRPIPI